MTIAGRREEVHDFFAKELRSLSEPMVPYWGSMASSSAIVAAVDLTDDGVLPSGVGAGAADHGLLLPGRGLHVLTECVSEESEG